MKNAKKPLISKVSILLIILLLGFGGFFLYQKTNDRKTDESSRTSETSQSDIKKSDNSITTTEEPSQPNLFITDWNIQIKPAVLKPDITYKIDKDDNGIERALFTFKDLPSDCSNMYGLYRAKKGQSADDNGNKPESLPYSMNVGDYYYFVQHGQAGCSDSEKQNQLVKEFFGNPYSYGIEINK